jgi:hypothetical protein
VKPELTRSGVGDDRIVVPLGQRPGKEIREDDPEPEHPAVGDPSRV